MKQPPIKSEIWNCSFIDAEKAYSYAFLVTPNHYLAIYFHVRTNDIVVVKAVSEFHVRYLAYRHRFRIWDRIVAGGAPHIKRPFKLYDAPFLHDVKKSNAKIDYFINGEDDMPEVLATQEPVMSTFKGIQPNIILQDEFTKIVSTKKSYASMNIMSNNISETPNVIVERWDTPISSTKDLRFCYLLHGFFDTTIVFQDGDQNIYELVTAEVVPYQLINKPAIPSFHKNISKETNTSRCQNSPFYLEANDCGVLYFDLKDKSQHFTYLVETTSNFIEIAHIDEPKITKLEGITAEQRITDIISHHARPI